jgi:hypothetical protein
MPIIREVQKAGARTLRDIADALNACGVPTARGGRWFATSVSNVLARSQIGLCCPSAAAHHNGTANADVCRMESPRCGTDGATRQHRRFG